MESANNNNKKEKGGKEYNKKEKRGKRIQKRKKEYKKERERKREDTCTIADEQPSTLGVLDFRKVLGYTSP
jgi:hypothetical protein